MLKVVALRDKLLICVVEWQRWVHVLLVQDIKFVVEILLLVVRQYTSKSYKALELCYKF